MLRVTTAVDGAVFLGAALLNFGLVVPGPGGPYAFEHPVAAAGIGEVVIAALLAWAALWPTDRRFLGACVAAAFGIAFGLLSKAVVGAAHAVHVLLVPITALAFVGLGVLWVRRRSDDSGAAHSEATAFPAETLLRSLAVLLLAIDVAVFTGAAVLHTGFAFSPFGDRFAFPNPILAAAVVEGAIAVLASAAAIDLGAGFPQSWRSALVAQVLGIVGVAGGLTYGPQSGPDRSVHYVMAELLVVGEAVTVLGFVLAKRTGSR